MDRAKSVRPIRKERHSQQASPRDHVPPVGRVLRRAREHQGLALREVERRTGRSSAYLSQVERGVIKHPDPVVLLELAELYRLDFVTLAKWAGWVGELAGHSDNSGSARAVVRRVLELDEEQRAEILSYIEKLLRERRS